MITTCTVYHAIRTIAIWLQQPISIQHPMFDIKQQRTVKRQHTGWRAKKKKPPEKRYDAQWRNERFISWFTVSFFIRGFAFSCISYIDIKNTVANECQPFTRRRNILRFLRLKEKKICLTWRAREWTFLRARAGIKLLKDGVGEHGKLVRRH
jgi:hypothetical protein